MRPTIEFRESDSLFKLIVLSIEDAPQLPSSGDVLLSIEASSQGFSGHDDVWVYGMEFRTFCRQLVELNRTSQGEAKLTSLTPDKLMLKIFALDPRGHLAVQVMLDHRGGPSGKFQYGVKAAFEFDQTQLSTAAGHKWVREFAKS